MRAQIADLPGEDPLEPLKFNSFIEYIKWKRQCKEKIYSNEELKELKKEFRKLYQRAYYHERKKREHRVSIRLSHKEIKEISFYAQRHNGLSMNRFIKSTCLAYLENRYLLRNLKPVEDLISEVRKIGNNINQLVRVSHQKLNASKFQSIQEKDLKQLCGISGKALSVVIQTQRLIERKMESLPQRLDVALDEFLKSNPERISPLIKKLEGLLSQYENASN